ncbi:MAG: sensor histidine kinase [Janthinobacterium lividum]
MEDDSVLILTPIGLLIIWLVRRFLATATRLPELDKRLAKLWIPGVVFLVGFALLKKELHLYGDLIDNIYLLGILSVILWVAWRLRDYQPARKIGFAALPFVLCLLVRIGLQLGGSKLAKEYEDSMDLAYSVAFFWAIGLAFAARSQKKRLEIDAQRRAEEAAEQKRIEAANQELERLVAERTAAISQQTKELREALSELRLTQAQLIQAEKMASLGELTAGIAHEIQNPLNFVNNFAEVSSELAQELAEERSRAPRDMALEADLLVDLKQNMQKITQHGQRAASIVRGMLEHSRVNTGERQPTDLNALADEYLRLAYHGLRAKDKSFNATLQTDFAPALPPIDAVSQDIGRVLLNLFTNAFYAVRQRQLAGEPGYAPTVRVRTEVVDERVLVHVGDNGTGIPEAVQQKIFQPFFTTKPSGEGTGLGLSLAHDIITKGHGGMLTVRSQEGQGSDFEIALPLKMS